MSPAPRIRIEKEETLSEISDLVEVTASFTLVEVEKPSRSDSELTEPSLAPVAFDSQPTTELPPAPALPRDLAVLLPPPPIPLPPPPSTSLLPPPRRQSSFPAPARGFGSLPPLTPPPASVRSSALPPLNPPPASVRSSALPPLNPPPTSRRSGGLPPIAPLPAKPGPSERPAPRDSGVRDLAPRASRRAAEVATPEARPAEPAPHVAKPMARVPRYEPEVAKRTAQETQPAPRVSPREEVPQRASARRSATVFRRIISRGHDRGPFREAGLVLGFVLALGALGSVSALVVRMASRYDAVQPTSGVVVTVAGPGGAVVPVASVYVDGNLECEVAPCTLAKLPRGVHFVQVVAKGFVGTAARAVAVEGAEFLPVHFDLTPEAPPPSVPTAAAPIPVESLGFEAPSQSVKTTEAPVRSEVATGPATLNINSIPSSNVLLDGRPLGPTPQSVRVSPGAHSVLFVSPEYGRVSRDVTVGPGTHRTVAVRLGG